MLQIRGLFHRRNPGSQKAGKLIATTWPVRRKALRKLFLGASLALLLAPYGALAQDNDKDGHHHGRKGSAPEMPDIGLAAAAAIGVTGYLVLRRRQARKD